MTIEVTIKPCNICPYKDLRGRIESDNLGTFFEKALSQANSPSCYFTHFLSKQLEKVDVKENILLRRYLYRKELRYFTTLLSARELFETLKEEKGWSHLHYLSNSDEFVHFAPSTATQCDESFGTLPEMYVKKL